MRIAPLLHPLHPALAHFPVAFWVGASISDLIGLRAGGAQWWIVSRHAIAAGVIMGVLAVSAGLLELWRRTLARPAVRWLLMHASLMSLALLCFMVSLSQRQLGPPGGAALALSFFGSGIVLAGGFCGGTLVYRFGVGVAEGGE